MSAVFVTYLGIGVALYWVLQELGRWSVLMSSILNSTMIILLAVAAGLSIGDAIRCLQGRASDMKLTLPQGIKKKLKLTIARRSRLGLTVGGTLTLGCLVAFLEFPCTGQVYTPIVVKVREFGYESWRALLWLLLYNICFILPLVAIFLCIYLGVSSERLGQLFRRHVAKTKFALGLVFLGLIVVLLVTM